MNMMRSLGLFLSCFLFCLAARAEPAANFSSRVQEWTTASGAMVYFLPRPGIRFMDLSVVFYAGSARDGNTFGLANMATDLLNQGSVGMTANQTADAFDNVGAQYGAYVSKRFEVVSLRSLTRPDYLNVAASTFNKILTNPTFEEPSIGRVKGQIRNAIQDENQSPDQVAFKTLNEALYGLSYGHSALGTEEALAAITPVEIRAFYQTYDVAKNATVFLVGDLTREDAEKLVNTVLQNLPVGERAAPLPVVTQQQSGVTIIKKIPGLTQSTILEGQLINLPVNQRAGFGIANFLLGGDFKSRMMNILRTQEGFVYGASSNFNGGGAETEFVLQTATNKDVTSVLNVLNADILKPFFAGPVSLQEFEEAQKSRLFSFIVNDDNFLYMARFMQVLADHVSLDYFDHYVKEVHAQTSQSVYDIFKSVVDPKKFVTVIVTGVSS